MSEYHPDEGGQYAPESQASLYLFELYFEL